MNIAVIAPRSAAAAHEPPQPPHTEFLGLRFYLGSQADAVKLIIEQTGAPYRYVVTPNAYDVVAAHDTSKQLLPIYREAWLSVCDSRIVRALARLERRALPLIPGSDLVAELLAKLDDGDRRRATKRVLIVGPPRRTETALRAIFPNLDLEVMPAPAGLSQSAAMRLEVARACLNSRWDIALLVRGLSGPGIDRPAARRTGLPIRRRALRRRIHRFSDRGTKARAAAAAAARPGMGLSVGDAAAAAVAQISRQIAEDRVHISQSAAAANAR